MQVTEFCVFLSFSCLATVAYAGVPYEEKYFDQTVDHFSFASNGTFKQRYLIQDKWWDKGKGPVFFYTGNEGDIVEFWQNTGFMFDIAPQFRALVVFAEHRYYGKSVPFGPKQSFVMPHIGFLTVEQALADYAVLIQRLKVSLNATHTPVVCFGGSYGGMLSAYMRFKYPNVVVGAISASAPIYLVGGGPRAFFFQDVTKDFKEAMPGCDTHVRQAFRLMNQKAATTAGLQELTKTFHTCDALKTQQDYRHLLLWLRNVFTVLAMMDYPYPTQFLAPLPGNPVKKACELLTQERADFLQNVADVADMVYGKPKSCHDLAVEFLECADPTGCTVGPTSLAWDFQACGELPMPAGSDNVTDMFPVLPFTPAQRTEYCRKRWGVTPRLDWFSASMWGSNIKAASNIVFSNGDLDPWHRGGVLSDVSSSVKAVMIQGGAHHLDLRSHNRLDPQSVKDARKLEVEQIQRWLKES